MEASELQLCVCLCLCACACACVRVAICVCACLCVLCSPAVCDAARGLCSHGKAVGRSHHMPVFPAMKARPTTFSAATRPCHEPWSWRRESRQRVSAKQCGCAAAAAGPSSWLARSWLHELRLIAIPIEGGTHGHVRSVSLSVSCRFVSLGLCPSCLQYLGVHCMSFSCLSLSLRLSLRLSLPLVCLSLSLRPVPLCGESAGGTHGHVRGSPIRVVEPAVSAGDGEGHQCAGDVVGVW